LRKRRLGVTLFDTAEVQFLTIGPACFAVTRLIQ
jgi:hypothetical protein